MTIILVPGTAFSCIIITASPLPREIPKEPEDWTVLCMLVSGVLRRYAFDVQAGLSYASVHHAHLSQSDTRILHRRISPFFTSIELVESGTSVPITPTSCIISLEALYTDYPLQYCIEYLLSF
ncbi:MAG: hypothetical protein EAX81_01795 [Candidatus Thorarchaeota archaeon]|nr:hypothetical protein [Candidatus Thorarchaeota archaeon]